MSDSVYVPASTDAVPSAPVDVPLTAISAGALTGIVDDFVLREGTEYGAQDVSLEAKRERVRKQLTKGDVKIVFDPDSESVTLLTKEEFRRRLHAANAVAIAT